jgi:hypothetical protein
MVMTPVVMVLTPSIVVVLLKTDLMSRLGFILGEEAPVVLQEMTHAVMLPLDGLMAILTSTMVLGAMMSQKSPRP